MRIHTWSLDGKREFVKRSRIFRMLPRDMAIACLSGWELKKSSWQILTFPKHRPATTWPSCCMMVACATVPGKAKISREVLPFSISRGRHMLWMLTCVGHGSKAVFRDHDFDVVEPLVFGQKYVLGIFSLRNTRIRVDFPLNNDEARGGRDQNDSDGYDRDDVHMFKNMCPCWHFISTWA